MVIFYTLILNKDLKSYPSSKGLSTVPVHLTVSFHPETFTFQFPLFPTTHPFFLTD